MPSFWRICVASTEVPPSRRGAVLPPGGNIADLTGVRSGFKGWAIRPRPGRLLKEAGNPPLARSSRPRAEPPRHADASLLQLRDMNAILRSTKIVATLGPSSSDPETLERMFRAGVDVVRLNFSHGKAEDHLRGAGVVRDMCRQTGRTVAIMVDLQGPKIRIGRFKEGRVTLKKGDAFTLDAERETGGPDGVGLDYKELPQDVRTGDTLLLDDGRIVFQVTEVSGTRVHCRVVHGGELSNNKGINRKGGGLSAPALTAKDMEDIRTAARMKADFVAVSFPKSSADMYMARQGLRPGGREAKRRGT